MTKRVQPAKKSKKNARANGNGATIIPPVGSRQVSNMVGRPSSFKEEYIKQAAAMARLGATDRDLAQWFEVSINTIWYWKAQHREFLDAVAVSKSYADERVVHSLYMRAIGYTYDSEKVFYDKDSGNVVRVPIQEHLAPDVTACIFWLKNRRPDLWRDVQHQNHNGVINLVISKEESRL
jgi:hypothetical protein